MARLLALLILVVSLLLPNLAVSEDEYKQVTITVPEHKIDVTFYVYTAFHPFHEVAPTVVVKMPESKFFTLFWRGVDSFNYGLIVNSLGTKALAIVEYDRELFTVDNYIMDEAGYPKWTTRIKLIQRLMELEDEWLKGKQST